MKITRLILILFLLLAGASNVQAQVNRNVGRSYDTPNKKKKNIDYVALSVQQLSKELTLDGFQEAVIKDILKSSTVEQEKILLLEIPNESKNEQLLAVRDEVNKKIIAVLTPIQIEKFEEMKEKAKKK